MHSARSRPSSSVLLALGSALLTATDGKGSEGRGEHLFLAHATTQQTSGRASSPVCSSPHGQLMLDSVKPALLCRTFSPEYYKDFIVVVYLWLFFCLFHVRVSLYSSGWLGTLP